MNSHRSLLRASLLAIATPVFACGGSTTDEAPAGAAGAGGGSAGSSAGSSNGGKAGSTTGGAAGKATAGSGGTTTAGTGGTTSAGTGGTTTAGTGGTTSAGTGGTTSAGTGGTTSAGTGGSGGKANAGSGGSAGKAGAGSGGATTGGSGGGISAGSGGTATGGTGGSAGGSAGSAGAPPYACTNPVAILVDGKDTGYDTCSGGELRRRDVVECPNLVPRADKCVSGLPSGDTCSSDADCTLNPNGYCSVSSGFGPGGCACQYGCLKDADCGSGNICVCGDPVGQCRPAGCASALDCKQGECTSYDSSKGCGFITFACQTTSDTCGGDLDCQAQGVNNYCSYGVDASGVQETARTCQPGGCAIGRPLFVDEAIRTSRLVARGDWA